MKTRPYVGITGFKTIEEVKKVGQLFEEDEFMKNSNYQPMFGYLASSKRLNDITTPGSQGPAMKDLKKLILSSPKDSIPMLHYHTKEMDNLASEVEKLFSIDNIYDHCKAVQLNMAWPKLNQIESIKHTFPEMQIVLQIPKRASDDLSSKDVGLRSQKYDELVSYVLIDPSGGFGIPFDVPKTVELMYALNDTMPNTIIGVAGGLSGVNVKDRVNEIKSNFSKPFCIDAQGRLRKKVNGESVLDFDAVQKYITNAGLGFF